MDTELDARQRTDPEAAAAGERRARVWRRYRAVLVLGEGQPPAAVAATLGCGPSSVYGWAAAWRRNGLAGLRGQPHGGGVVALAARAGAVLERPLGEDPQARGHQATGGTAPLLRAELATAGHAASAKTVRRALPQLGYRWTRPKYVLGRPDPADAEQKTP